MPRSKPSLTDAQWEQVLDPDWRAMFPRLRVESRRWVHHKPTGWGTLAMWVAVAAGSSVILGTLVFEPIWGGMNKLPTWGMFGLVAVVIALAVVALGLRMFEAVPSETITIDFADRSVTIDRQFLGWRRGETFAREQIDFVRCYVLPLGNDPDPATEPFRQAVADRWSRERELPPPAWLTQPTAAVATIRLLAGTRVRTLLRASGHQEVERLMRDVASEISDRLGLGDPHRHRDRPTGTAVLMHRRPLLSVSLAVFGLGTAGITLWSVLTAGGQIGLPNALSSGLAIVVCGLGGLAGLVTIEWRRTTVDFDAELLRHRRRGLTGGRSVEIPLTAVTSIAVELGSVADDGRPEHRTIAVGVDLEDGQRIPLTPTTGVLVDTAEACLLADRLRVACRID